VGGWAGEHIVTDRIQVVQVGLGSLGRQLTPFLVGRPQLEIVGAADVDAALVGRDLGDVAGLGERLGVTVTDQVNTSFAPEAAAAVLTTVSGLDAARPQIERLLESGLNVVSSCEELAYPWTVAPGISAGLDERARGAGASVLGTGVNPGFLMDFLPAALTAVCREVRKVTVLRRQDARSRRLAFQEKIGAGLTPEEFERRKRAGTLRHVGLTESMHFIAGRLGWRLERTEDIVEPVIAQQEVTSDRVTVEPGQAAGLCQLGLGFADGEERIRLEFRACLGEREAQDTVIVEGTPSIRFTIPGGLHGDLATCAILTNAIPVVVQAPPGLHTMADISPLSWFSGQRQFG
jgi:4-hydroxy-tetrahydrodipicolinate reductase